MQKDEREINTMKTLKIFRKILAAAGCTALLLSGAQNYTFADAFTYSSELVLNSEDNSAEMEERGMYGRFYIPSLGINVALFDGTGSSGILQALVDAEDSAAYFTRSTGTTYIAEHRHQSNMKNIADVVPGETLAYIQQGSEVYTYICAASGIGTNEETYLADENGVNMDYASYGGYNASFITYTCTETSPYVYYAVWVSCDDALPEAGEESSVSVCEEMLSLFNAVRAEYGLYPLVWSDNLLNGASIRVVEASEYWSHTRPDGSAWYTADDVYLYGEILAKGFDTAEGALEGWMNSDSHRALVLTDHLETVCIVKYTASDGTTYWCTEFGYNS